MHIVIPSIGRDAFVGRFLRDLKQRREGATILGIELTPGHLDQRQKSTCEGPSFYLYDLPGYGDSVIPPTSAFEPSYPAQTKVLCRLLDHWKGADETFRPHVVAHDIGGHLALRTLLLENRSFASLALVDCGAAFPVDEPFFSLVKGNTSVFQSLPLYLHDSMVREYIRRASFRGLRGDQEDLLVGPWVSDPQGQAAFYRQIVAQKNSDVEVLAYSYRKIPGDEMPLHIIWAKQDTWVPIERAKMLQDAVGGTLSIVEDAGHLIHFDAPERLMGELVRWLSAV